MFRKPWVRWPITLVVGVFALLNLQQGVDILLDGEDWSDDYATLDATVVDSIETEWSGSTVDDHNIERYRCTPVLEFSVDGTTHRAEAIWLTQRYNRSRGPGCVDQAYGESLPVLLGGDSIHPMIFDPENPPEASETAFANLAIAAFGALLLWRLWRPIQPDPSEAAAGTSA